MQNLPRNPGTTRNTGKMDFTRKRANWPKKLAKKTNTTIQPASRILSGQHAPDKNTSAQPDQATSDNNAFKRENRSTRSNAGTRSGEHAETSQPSRDAAGGDTTKSSESHEPESPFPIMTLGSSLKLAVAPRLHRPSTRAKKRDRGDTTNTATRPRPRGGANAQETNTPAQHDNVPNARRRDPARTPREKAKRPSSEAPTAPWQERPTPLLE